MHGVVVAASLAQTPSVDTSAPKPDASVSALCSKKKPQRKAGKKHNNSRHNSTISSDSLCRA